MNRNLQQIHFLVVKLANQQLKRKINPPLQVSHQHWNLHPVVCLEIWNQLQLHQLLQPNSQQNPLYSAREPNQHSALLQLKQSPCSEVVNQPKFHPSVKLISPNRHLNLIQVVALEAKDLPLPQTLNLWALRMQQLKILNPWDLQILEVLITTKQMLCLVSHLEILKVLSQPALETRMLSNLHYLEATLKMQLLEDSKI